MTKVTVMISMCIGYRCCFIASAFCIDCIFYAINFYSDGHIFNAGVNFDACIKVASISSNVRLHFSTTIL